MSTLVDRQPLTIGVEEEYQIIDPVTRNLHSYYSELLSIGAQRATPIELKAELMQSQVEVGSQVCANIGQVRDELVDLRRTVAELAAERGLRIAAASTHPFAAWEEQAVTEGNRYRELLDDMQGVARRLLVFGMHVHIGFESDPESKDLLIEIMNQARYFMPHLLALSTSSPFWHGRNTGLHSYRSVVFEMLPRTGIPHSFSSWAEYLSYERTLLRTGALEKDRHAPKIWWDIRPHSHFGTLEFRIADICTRVDEAVCVAALFQAICAKLLRLRRNNMSWRRYRHIHITENKWRAVRYGIHADLVDFGSEETVPFPLLIEELLEIVDDVVDDLGSRNEVEYALTILENGTSADRQLQVFEEHGGQAAGQQALDAVVDHLVADSGSGIY